MGSYANDTLRKRALVSHLTIKKYSAKKTDQGAAKRIEEENEAKTNTTQVKKKLLQSDKMKLFISVENKARQCHYKMTFPWTDTGLRLLPVNAHEDYIGQMGLLQDEALSLADDIAKEYPRMKQEAKEFLGSLYNEDDYPHPSVIRGYFAFDVVIAPLPQMTDDIRTNLTDEQARMIKEETEARMEKALEESVDEAWSRLYKIAYRIKDRMLPENSFHYTTIDNAREIADLLPKLNITQDPKLDELAVELKTELGPYDANSLRRDDDKRKEVKDGMDSILSKINDLKGRQ